MCTFVGLRALTGQLSGKKGEHKYTYLYMKSLVGGNGGDLGLPEHACAIHF